MFVIKVRRDIMNVLIRHTPGSGVYKGTYRFNYNIFIYDNLFALLMFPL